MYPSIPSPNFYLGVGKDHTPTQLFAGQGYRSNPEHGDGGERDQSSGTGDEADVATSRQDRASARGASRRWGSGAGVGRAGAGTRASASGTGGGTGAAFGGDVTDAGVNGLLEVGARDAGLVGEVEDEAQVAEESLVAVGGGGKLVQVGGCEGVRGDSAVFAAQVTDLAGLREGLVAGGGVAADEGVEVRLGFGAVAILGDGSLVQVVG